MLAYLHLHLYYPTDLQFRIKIIFTKSVTGVLLKLVKLEKKDKKVWI